MAGVADVLVSNSKANPQLGDTIVTTASLPYGRYRVQAATAPTGTVAAGDLNNVQLQVGATVIGTLLQAATANILWQNQAVVVNVPVAGAAILITAVANSSVGAPTYNGQLSVHQEAAY